MPNLGDLLGHLMSEITIARMHADIEAIRIAELYSTHPLLRNLPIPHFRLPNIDIDVTIVIKEIEQATSTEQPRGTPSIQEMRNKFYEVFDKHLRDASIHLDIDTENKLRMIIDERMQTLEKPKEVSIDTNRIADEFSDIFYSVLSESKTIDKENIEDSIKAMRNLLRVEFQNLRKTPNRLQVLVTTNEIREANLTGAVTQLHLKITEEAFEWTSIESGGKTSDRLVIE